ncbi:MAG TPA: hypothetical protein VFT20_08495, partial [Candidatus Limnocylindrales bacterium]|nr:hypothetical protein [Candidatus Limnocylindrales bacterium]
MKRLPFVTVLGLLAVAIAVTLGGSFVGAPASGSPTASASEPPLAGAPTPAPEATPTPAPTDPPTPTPVPIADIPIVPVTNFRTTVERTGYEEVRAALAGTTEAFDSVELVEAEAEAILASLGAEAEAAAAGPRLILAPDAATLMTDLASNQKRLAFLRADAIGPAVRALGWGDRTLFGVGAVDTVEAWGLTAALPGDG